MLHLQCECPIFGVLRHYRKCTNGRGANSVKLVLDVPDERIKLTEYSVWADFMFYCQYTKPYDFTKVDPMCMEEISQKRLNRIIRSIKTQKKPGEYRIPQVVLEELRPEWLVSYKVNPRKPPFEFLKKWFYNSKGE